MKAKQAILLVIFFVVIIAGMLFVTGARARQARAQAEAALQAAMQQMQEANRLLREKKK